MQLVDEVGEPPQPPPAAPPTPAIDPILFPEDPAIPEGITAEELLEQHREELKDVYDIIVKLMDDDTLAKRGDGKEGAEVLTAKPYYTLGTIPRFILEARIAGERHFPKSARSVVLT